MILLAKGKEKYVKDVVDTRVTRTVAKQMDGVMSENGVCKTVLILICE